MPICTSCTQPVSYLYTVYGSKYNLRLEQCPNCHEFVDPYVEHDELTILLDLILLKRGVYRHLLFNRGTEPRRLCSKTTEKVPPEARPPQERSDRWKMLLKLGVTLVLLDAFIRWSHIKPKEKIQIIPWNREILLAFFRFFLGTTAEALAFHGGIVFSSVVIMKIMKPILTPSNIHKEFRVSMISLSLFYSSLTKFFLLFLLTVWLPAAGLPSRAEMAEMAAPSWLNRLWTGNSHFLSKFFEILDDNKLDREWLVRNVLGGMSAGFGLRVILDIHPIFTTIIILSGWFAKNTMAVFVSGWVGGNARAGEAWLAYSIP